MIKCIKEKCPKYEQKFGFYNCRLDNSCSKYELTYCKADEFFQRKENDFLKIKELYDLISKNQSK